MQLTLQMFAVKNICGHGLSRISRAMSTGKFVGGRPLRLQDKVAVVTGAAGGIGRVSLGYKFSHASPNDGEIA